MPYFRVVEGCHVDEGGREHGKGAVFFSHWDVRESFKNKFVCFCSI